jgi:hypothetical protein
MWQSPSFQTFEPVAKTLGILAMGKDGGGDANHHCTMYKYVSNVCIQYADRLSRRLGSSGRTGTGSHGANHHHHQQQ